MQVVTGFPNFPTGDLAPGYRVRRCLDERDGPGVAVRRVALYPEPRPEPREAGLELHIVRPERLGKRYRSAKEPGRRVGLQLSSDDGPAQHAGKLR